MASSPANIGQEEVPTEWAQVAQLIEGELKLANMSKRKELWLELKTMMSTFESRYGLMYSDTMAEGKTSLKREAGLIDSATDKRPLEKRSKRKTCARPKERIEEQDQEKERPTLSFLPVRGPTLLNKDSWQLFSLTCNNSMKLENENSTKTKRQCNTTLFTFWQEVFGQRGYENIKQLISCAQVTEALIHLDEIPEMENSGHESEQVTKTKMISAYRQHAKYNANPKLKASMVYFHMAEFAGFYATLVNYAKSPSSATRHELVKLGLVGSDGKLLAGVDWRSAVVTYCTRLIHGQKDPGTPVSEEQRTRIKKDVARGKLYQEILKAFGKGVLLLLPPPRDNTFRAWRSEAITAFVNDIAKMVPQTRTISERLYTQLLLPLLLGKPVQCTLESLLQHSTNENSQAWLSMREQNLGHDLGLHKDEEDELSI